MERIVLQASKGMVYTNGVNGGKTIYLSVGETAEGWHEVPEDAFVEAIESGVLYGQISDAEALSIITGGTI